MEPFEKFRRFHRQNKSIWELFKGYSFEAINAGKKHYSAKSIFERIRWHVEVQTTGCQFKLNNDYTAYYARLFHAAFPNYEGFFRNRLAMGERIPRTEFLKLISGNSSQLS